ncbi:hypothetical protein CRE_02829 [Caenorhabditis remanei]|uniref:Uncharacterized protein n=1 Tax=Caenorhabditis remanei TaxID=31234 RepID=E3LX75_CAERE|nr:hypothetical protein CRE_02829 [Caenorhabditis remanei]
MAHWIVSLSMDTYSEWTINSFNGEAAGFLWRPLQMFVMLLTTNSIVTGMTLYWISYSILPSVQTIWLPDRIH